MPSKKSWQQKLADSKDLPKIQKVEGKMSRRWGEGMFVIPAPMEVDEIMRKIPRGKLVTINEMRAKLAKKHKVNFGCPITTGIFAWIAANAAEEKASEGKKRITPYWRTLKAGGELNPKYPGGIRNIRSRLKAEGHKVVSKGKKFVVEDYEKSLARL